MKISSIHQGKIHIWPSLKTSELEWYRKNITHEEDYKKIETDLDIPQIIELVDKDIKTVQTIFLIFREVEERLRMLNWYEISLKDPNLKDVQI